MTYDQFEAIWTQVVTRHVPSSRKALKGAALSKGVSQKLVAALVSAAKGDHSALDAAERKSR